VSAKPLRQVDLYTDAGTLEGLYRELENPSGVAVICHPHPVYGGTLHNKVVFRAARGLERANFATLRFNFRGAGRSEGTHDSGEGEQRDFEAALDWIKARHPGVRTIAGGFSFGSWIASRVACTRPDVEAIFLIGAPINKYDLSYLKYCDKPLFFLHGTDDEHGDAEKLSTLAQSCHDAELVLVTGADHFFKDQIDVVEEAIREWASALTGE
jgi:alpha/beta superfamily hydrolase